MSKIENLVGCRSMLACAFASVAMIAMSTSGAVAVVGCAGTAGTSGFTSVQAQFNLQCMQPIILPTTLQPLQSFGGSELVRTGPSTATYYLADRTNRGIIVVNATNMTYKSVMKPVTTGAGTPILNTAGAIIGYRVSDPTGGFMGAAIYATGPSNQGTTRIGTVEESNSGPNFMAVYENPGDPNDHRWMLVTDGSCLINNNGGGYSSPAAGGSMRSCSTPADPSVAGTATTFAICASASCANGVAPYGTTHGVTNYVSKLNPLLSTANCTNPGPQYLTSAGLSVKTVCYPQNHQSNVKLFNLRAASGNGAWVATFPNGGGCLDNGYQNAVGGGQFQVPMAPCTAPLGLYAPPSAAAPHGYSVTGRNGQGGSADIAIGVDSYAADPNTNCVKAAGKGCVYVLVAGPNENTPRNVGCQLSQVFNPPTNCAETPQLLGPTTGANGGCSENAPAAQGQTAPKNTFIQPWDDVVPVAQTAAYPGTPVGIQGQTGGPYMTLFAMDPGTGYLYYQATIKIDDHQSTNGPAIPPGVAGPLVNGVLTSVLPNARQMVVESGFRGCDLKGRHGPELGQVAWNPQAGVGGAFMIAIPNVNNNPPICYIASLDNLCGPPTTGTGAGGVILTATNAAALALIPPGPGAFSQNFQALSATSQGPGCIAGVLGVGCRSVSQNNGVLTNPFLPAGPIGLNGGFNDFYLPGPFPPVDPLPLFAHLNPNNQTPVPAGCTAQYPAVPPANGGGTCGGTHPFVPPNAQSGSVCSTTTCPLATGNQVMGGTINGPNVFNTGLSVNAVTEARFNMSNATKDPHYYVAVGARGWSAANINPTTGAPPANSGPATRGPVLAYIDGLTNVNVETVPTSSGSNTIALDEQNYVVFLPVNGVLNSGLPAGDFTGNGARLCGNTTTRNGLTTGPGCIIVFKQQYLSPLGGGPVMGN